MKKGNLNILDSPKKQRHSGAYHKFFEGYAEHIVVTDDGGLRIERKYVMDYYRQKSSDREYLLQKAAVLVLSLFITALFVAASVARNELSVSYAIRLPVGLSVIMMMFYWKAIVECLAAPRLMMMRHLRAVRDAAPRWTTGLAAILAVAFIMAAVVAAHLRVLRQVNVLVCVGEYLLSAVLAVAVAVLMRRTEFEIVPNQAEYGKGDIIVTYYREDE